MTKKRNHPSPKISQHPLMGVRLGNLFTLLSSQDAISLAQWPFIAAFAASALGRWPFSRIDRWKARHQRLKKRLAPPVFIVGYWRSGTTHLHNLMAQSPEMGIITPLGSGLPDELLTLATWLKPLLEKGLPEDRGVDDVAVTPRSPQEDEIPVANLQPLSVFHALYFPAQFRENFNRGVFFDGVTAAEIARWKDCMQYFLGKVARHQRKQPLLIKNPVYTARIDLLRELWPEARFIHIHRNPYRVFRSTMHYYPKMIDDLGLQAYDPSEIEPVVLASYPRMLHKLEKDTCDLPQNQFIEVTYEALDAHPLAVLEQIYRQLQLSGWEKARSNTEAYLQSIASYQKNEYNYEQSDLEKVETHWGEFVDKWQYERPVS